MCSQRAKWLIYYTPKYTFGVFFFTYTLFLIEIIVSKNYNSHEANFVFDSYGYGPAAG